MQNSQELEKDCESIQKIVKSKIQEEIQKINQQIIQKNSKIDRLMEITIALEKQSGDNKMLEELNLEIKDELEQTKVELQNKYYIIQQKESELASAFEQNQALQNEIKNLDDISKTKDQEIKQLASEIINLNQDKYKYEKLETQLLLLQENCSQLVQENQILKDQINNYQVDIEDLKQQVQQLRTENQQHLMKLEELEKQSVLYKQLQVQDEEKEVQLQQVQLENGKIKAIVAQLQEQLNTLEQQNAKDQKAIWQLQSFIKRQNIMNKEEMKELIAKNEQEIQYLKQEHRIMEQSKKEQAKFYEKQIEQLEKQLRVIREQQNMQINDVQINKSITFQNQNYIQCQSYYYTPNSDYQAMSINSNTENQAIQFQQQESNQKINLQSKKRYLNEYSGNLSKCQYCKNND